MPNSKPHPEPKIKPATAIRIVRPEQFEAATAQTPGSTRLAAIPGSAAIPSSMWAGTFLVEPGGKTGIHHHGAQQTVVYVLEGEAEVRWGDRGEHRAIARAGDFVHVPAFLVHMESNASAEKPFRWIVIRSTPKPVVIHLPANTWA